MSSAEISTQHAERLSFLFERCPVLDIEVVIITTRELMNVCNLLNFNITMTQRLL